MARTHDQRLALSHTPTWLRAAPWAETKDTVNFATMEKLRAHGLSVANILTTPDDVLHELIKAVVTPRGLEP